MSAEVGTPVEPARVETDPAHRRAVLMLLATAILWSLGGLLIKWVNWHPVAIAGMRSLIGAAVGGIRFDPRRLDRNFVRFGAHAPPPR
jgi:drug/metabolite transporter (DMT)-like permease